MREIEVKVINKNNEMSQEEMEAYIRMLEERNGRSITSITFELDGDYVNCSYTLASVPFTRIRRITGYLVGTLDNWNDAKRAEESDRIKHEYEMEKL